MPFQFQRLTIPEIVLIKARQSGDDRGFFKEIFKTSDFVANGISITFIQDNLSHSMHRVLRGLHYQKHPRAQGKLVTALTGRIFDVAVDIRQGSPTFGRWVGEILSAENGYMLYVPPGFAHGFCVLSEAADVFYKATDEYAPGCERGIIWNDPTIGVEWPVAEPRLSPRDTQLPPLEKADNNFTID